MSGGVKLPARTARLEFEGDYQGIWVRVRLNVKLRTLLDLQQLSTSEDVKELRQGFEAFGREALLEWNLVDDNDQPIPVGAAGMLEIDPAFAQELITHWVEAVSQPPAPLAETSSNGSTSAEEESMSAVESSLNLGDLSKLS